MPAWAGAVRPPPAAFRTAAAMDSSFVVLILFFIIGMPLFLLAWKAGRESPQSKAFIFSVIVRRMLLPFIDVVLDWLTFASYWQAADYFEAGMVLGFLLLASFAMSLVACMHASTSYDHLESTGNKAGWVSLQESVGGFCAGLTQLSPLFFGRRAVNAWREITDDPRWRSTPADARVSQEALDEFVMLVAEMKHSVQFEALYEGGPQLVIQAWFVVRDWKRLSVRLMEPQGDAWLRLLSPVWSAVGLALSQLDFLVENDRFHNKIFKRDNAVVMLLALFDLGGQLAMRVIPLAVLMDVYWQLGIGCFGFGILWAYAVTWWVAVGPRDDGAHKCDLALNAIMYWPHNFFFAMTYFPGHGPDGHSYECQTTQRALISRWGLRFGILHAVFTVIVAYLCYGAELTNWGRDPTVKSMTDFGAQHRVEWLFGSAVPGLVCMVAARSALYFLDTHNAKTKAFFNQDARALVRDSRARLSSAAGRASGRGSAVSSVWGRIRGSTNAATRSPMTPRVEIRDSMGERPPPPPGGPPSPAGGLHGIDVSFHGSVREASDSTGPLPDVRGSLARSRKVTIESSSGGERSSGGSNVNRSMRSESGVRGPPTLSSNKSPSSYRSDVSGVSGVPASGRLSSVSGAGGRGSLNQGVTGDIEEARRLAKEKQRQKQKLRAATLKASGSDPEPDPEP